jgi:hypothetical protein
VATPVGNPFAARTVSGAELIARLPKIWIGYALAFAALIGELIAVARHPVDAGKGLQFEVPPLELFLPTFLAAVYWLVCIHRFHVILANVPGWKHPVSPQRAVWFHLIPGFNFYWLFRWPYAIAVFVNTRLHAQLMSHWLAGAGFLLALACRIFDPALGTAMLFLISSRISLHLKQALQAGVPATASFEQ